MTQMPNPGPADAPGFWLDHPDHRAYLRQHISRDLDFFSRSLIPGKAGFAQLGSDGRPLDSRIKELHATTRMVHSYALGHLQGYPGAMEVVDHGIAYLASHHRDDRFGGYLWALDGDDILDDRKLTYGQVFVLLAASTAKLAGHPKADALLADITGILDRHCWNEAEGLFHDEWARDWTVFSSYRGLNANMHGVEALLTAYEATGTGLYLDRAGRILDFFIQQVAPSEGWRLPEHYDPTWQIDREYAGDHMFRPAGTTPGHSFEMARLLLQHWDVSGRPGGHAPKAARQLIMRALDDAWLQDGGLAYTLHFDGTVWDASRFWWPVTEAINALAALIIAERNAEDEVWYRRLWQFAHLHFVDPQQGGWYPAIDHAGRAKSSIFAGKPDIYHALQASLFPLSGRLSHMPR